MAAPGVGAGTAPAGYPVVTPAAPAAGNQDGLVPDFDLATRTFPFADDGSLLLVHPVDQAVHLTLGTTRGTVKSAPDVGVDWARIRSALYAETPKAAAGEIARALAPLVQAGDVELRAVRFTRPLAGRQIVEVDYVNLRLPIQNSPTTGVRTARGSV